MARIVYVNGRYLPWGEAAVHAEDRGFQFGDAVYEVCEVRDGAIVDETRHVERLMRSLNELAMPKPMSAASLARVLRETVRRNRVVDGSIYLQVSRGTARRDFLFPKAGTLPTLVCLARPSSRAKADKRSETGISVVTVPDNRWGRCDIKTVMLLPASLAKEKARAAGADDAWFVDADGNVTEGASNNVWIVDGEGRLVTRHADAKILRGVTRMTLLDVLRREGVEVVERAFTVAEAQAAREVFITSASNILTPVVRIDGRPVGNGAPGMLGARLRPIFHQVAEMSPA
jgi:D-alanine transaminase